MNVSLLALYGRTRGCYALADDVRLVSSVDVGGQETRAPMLLDAATGLDVLDADASLNVLSVSTPAGTVELTTRARLELVELPVESLFRLPRILRAANAAPWIRGVIVRDAHPDAFASRSLAIWVDLPLFATAAQRQGTERG